MADTARRHRIFIVDDHQLVREGLAHLIAEDPMLEVCGDAESAEAALIGIQGSRPDLILVDISLGAATGLHLISELRDREPDLLTLVLSMYNESAYAERALQSGARGYIMKQRASSDLINAIHQVLAGKIYLSENMKEKVLSQFAKSSNQLALPTAVLSDRELEVFHLIGKGFKTRQIASTLHVSPKTVDSHCANIKVKLKLKDSGELVQYAILWHHDKSQS